MASSYVTYTGTGSQTDFTIPFSYLATSDVFAFVNGVSVVFSWINSSAIRIASAPPAGTAIQIQRITQKVSVPVDFTDGSVLLEADLDALARYTLYQAQENFDVSERIPAGAPGNVIGWDASGLNLVNIPASTGTSLVSLAASSGASLVGYQPTGGTANTVQAKLRESVSVKDFGAVGDGATDDTVAIQAALNLGIVACGVAGETYRITSGLAATLQGSVLDLNGASLLADFASGWAFSAGDGTTVTQQVGIRNGTIYTLSASTSLNGVRYRKNVRRKIAYENLYIKLFKGTGLKFEEANWSIQGAFAPLIEACGINLWLDDNANAISLAGCHLYDADTYNLVLRGVWATSIIGGVNQGANTAGVLIDNGLVGSLQASFQATFMGVYFENNGVNHIVANNGRGLNFSGNFVNGDLMTGPAIKCVGWTGADITGNTVSNMSSGSARDFVEADATSALIDVGQQHVSSIADAAICQYGGSKLGVIGARGTTTPTLPTASTLNRGSMLLYAPTSGTGVNRSRPYMCMDAGTGSRAFIRLATQPRKMSAAAVTTPYTPALASIETFDITVPTGGLTINAPSGAYEDGDRITFLLRQNSTGGSTLTWAAAYKTNFSNTGNSANTYASVEFVWSAGRSIWMQVSSLPWTS